MKTTLCSVPFCGHLVPVRKLMCPHHWAMVSKELQAAVYSAWNAGRPTEDYFRLRHAAIAHVVELQRRGADVTTVL